VNAAFGNGFPASTAAAALRSAFCTSFVSKSGMEMSYREVFARARPFSDHRYHFASTFGLIDDKQLLRSFVDAFYFTVITLTTVGYGDITPTTEIGRVAVALEAFVGFVLLATLASMIYRKILP
jgi:hypothetical protein